MNLMRKSLLAALLAMFAAAPALAGHHEDKMAGNTIVDVAAGNADFETLVAAV